jgi:hypothetical protein
MPNEASDLAQTVKAVRPTIPAKNFELSKRFYVELGFQANVLTDGLVEMSLGRYSFILQNYYVPEWADNVVMHVHVSNVAMWWDRIVALDLPARFGVVIKAPQLEEWGLVAGLVDPSGVLWRIAEIPDPQAI